MKKTYTMSSFDITIEEDISDSENGYGHWLSPIINSLKGARGIDGALRAVMTKYKDKKPSLCLISAEVFNYLVQNDMANSLIVISTLGIQRFFKIMSQEMAVEEALDKILEGMIK